jgi:two-component system chemotaxis response regulator CheY
MVILVVEDSSTMRSLICHTVQKLAGAVVIEATDGADALEKMNDIRPHVIVTDINMPKMDGFSFIERVRQRPEHATTPIVVLTMEDAREDRERAWKLGVRTYVTKPIRHLDVTAAVKSVLGHLSKADSEAQPEVVLRVDYDTPEELVGDYAASLSRGEIMIANSRAFAIGTAVRVALAFPGLVEPIQLDGIVRFSSTGDEATHAIELIDQEQRAILAALVERIRGGSPAA